MRDTTSSPEWLEAANFHATVAEQLATVVHQANNALQSIGGHAELLRTEPGASATTTRRADAITDVSRRLARLLTVMQTLAQPRRETSVVDLRHCVEDALALRQYRLGRAQILTSLESDGVTTILAEAHAVLQVVLNLIQNAEQALASSAGGRIGLFVRRVGDAVVLDVDDDGPGFPSIETGGRASAARDRLGLGLTVSRAIVLRFGGELSVSASDMGGTRVRVSLPATGASAAPSGTQAAE